MEQRLKFTLNKVTAKRHHRQHFSFNSIFFLSKLETPSGEYQHLARRSQQFWRDKESLCLTTSFIADLLGAGLNTNLFFVYFGAFVISFKFLTHFLILEFFTKV
jgi:rhamnogalacturonyl hydrolase YesR